MQSVGVGEVGFFNCDSLEQVTKGGKKWKWKPQVKFFNELQLSTMVNSENRVASVLAWHSH